MKKFLPKQLTYRRLGAYLLLIGISVEAYGCGLVSFGISTGGTIYAANPKWYESEEGGTINTANKWYELATPRAPKDPKEEAAFQAAISRYIFKSNEITAICLAADEKDQIVVTISGAPNISNPMSPKEITYYRITDEKISAFSETVQEPSPDVDYELTIYKAAVLSKENRNKYVIIYDRKDNVYTIIGNTKSCSAEVSLKAGIEQDKEPLSIRFVPICGH